MNHVKQTPINKYVAKEELNGLQHNPNAYAPRARISTNSSTSVKTNLPLVLPSSGVLLVQLQGLLLLLLPLLLLRLPLLLGLLGESLVLPLLGELGVREELGEQLLVKMGGSLASLKLIALDLSLWVNMLSDFHPSLLFDFF